MNTASWVIVEKGTGTAVFETFSKTVVAKIRKDRFTAIPILEYLQKLNQEIRDAKNQS